MSDYSDHPSSDASWDLEPSQLDEEEQQQQRADAALANNIPAYIKLRLFSPHSLARSPTLTQMPRASAVLARDAVQLYISHSHQIICLLTTLLSVRNFAPGGILDSQINSQQYVDGLYKGSDEDGMISHLPL